MKLKLHFVNRRLITILICVGISCFLLNIKVFAWGGDNHRIISKAAVQLLLNWEQELLGNAADSLIERYCLYPDWYRSAVRDENNSKIAQYKPYVQLPLLQELGTWHRNEDDDSEICFYIVATLMHNAVKHLRSDNPLEAARYMGSLLHFIEDNACPVHVVNNKLLAELLPKPEQLESFSLHSAVERPSIHLEISDYKPILLGKNIIEAAEVFYWRFLQNRLTARAQSVVILQAIYAGNEQEADKGRIRSALPAAKLVADVIHTICVIARENE